MLKYSIQSLFIVTLTVFLFSSFAYADEPKFKNPAPKLTPVSKAEEKRLEKIKLGKPPKLSKEELEKIAKGKVVVRRLSKEGDAYRYEAYGAIPAAPKQVMAFMKNYELKPKVYPSTKAIDVSWKGNMAIVDITIEVAWKEIKYRLHMVHYGDHFIETEFIHGDIKDTNGFYKLFPYDGGNKTLMVYNVYSDPGIALPGFILNMLTKSSLPDTFEAVRKGVKLMQGKKK